MKTKLLFIFTIFILCNTGSYSQWTQQSSGTSAFLNSIGFDYNGTGYACGYAGVIVKTTNLGANWILMPPTSSSYLYAVEVLTDLNVIFVGASGDIIKTTNGGTNWIHQVSNTTQILRGVSFATTNVGVVVGDNGTIQLTSNGGTNWIHSTMDFNGADNYYSVDLYNTSAGWLCGYNSGAIIQKTTNSGALWVDQSTGLADHILRDIRFRNASTGVAVGDGGYIVRTTNGGTNWLPVNSGLTNDLQSIDVGSHIFTNYTWYAAGFGGKVIKSTNDGATWVQLNSGTTNNLFEIDVLTATRDTVYACGGQGIIINTWNGGSAPTAITQNGNSIPSDFNLSQNYPNPFNPSTNISFSIPEKSMVTLEVYDMLGNKVSQLVKGEINLGKYTVQYNATGLSSGIYFYRLNAVGTKQEFSKTLKFMLVK